MIAAVLLLIGLLQANVVAGDGLYQTNFVLIMFDDLRPDMNCYGRDFMITPNFDRLAARSVVFDYNYCQIAVCNPSRDSLITGLRPDSVGTYNFQHSFWPHLPFPTQLARTGYNTAGFGKILHWEGNDRNVWNFDSWENDWYGYQGREDAWMNSSTMPDKIKKEENFRDHEFTDRAISTLKKMHEQPNYFMLAIGYKLPHLAVHVPHKYYEMYKGKQEAWKLPKRALRFPYSVSEISYRCCASHEFRYMNQEGGMRWNRTTPLGNINQQWTNEMHDELMMGYAAGVTFVDKQVGRLLDALDELKLWNNVTIILTADHGMHNGEKGIWEKWSLFEESTRIPLIISHPLSPHQGKHYPYPVELIDVYATMDEILKLPKSRKSVCKGEKCKPLEGKSLAPVVLGKALYEKEFGKEKLQASWREDKFVHEDMPALDQDFAISQAIRCAARDRIKEKPKTAGFFQGTTEPRAPPHQREAIWNDCNMDIKTDKDEMALLGYSMRTPKFRYTAYFHFDRAKQLPKLDEIPYEEELFDHRNETLAEFTHRETTNLASRPTHHSIVLSHRQKLVTFIKEKVKFGDH